MDSFPNFEQFNEKKVNKNKLQKAHNLKNVFNEIRDYFAGNVSGITRDETIAKNLMQLLFCKIFDERHKKKDPGLFTIQPGQSSSEIKKNIEKLFNQVKEEYPDIFEEEEEIALQEEDLLVVVSKLESFSLLTTERDVIGDAFEEIIGRGFRGGEGQFFTPRNVVKTMIDILQPKQGEKILDPACGSAGFLAYILRYMHTNQITDFTINGIEKDEFLSKIANTYLLLLGGKENCHVYCENSLVQPEKWHLKTNTEIKLESYDIILTNPPFGAKIPVVGKDLLAQYDLGYVWKQKSGLWTKTTKKQDKQPPQILFIERCMQFLKEEGRMGIVLPEGIFGNPSDRYIWEYLSEIAEIMGIISLAQETFQPGTHTKTSILFLKKSKKKSTKPIFMAVAENIGHNKNGKELYKIKSDGSVIVDQAGNSIVNDDLPFIVEKFQSFLHSKGDLNSHIGFTVNKKDINDHIYIPEYYDPDISNYLDQLAKSGSFELVSIDSLINKKYITISRGNEVGSQFYGSGEIPFVRTTDIVNWEIKFDPIKAVAEEVYLKYKKNQDIQEKDILFVNDGTFLIGRSSMVTELDKKIVLQSHLRKIRVLENDFIDPFYLFYVLNTNIVQKQIVSKTFVQATISTIGGRIKELILPIHKDKNKRSELSAEIESIIFEKMKLRKKIQELKDHSI